MVLVFTPHSYIFGTSVKIYGIWYHGTGFNSPFVNFYMSVKIYGIRYHGTGLYSYDYKYLDIIILALEISVMVVGFKILALEISIVVFLLEILLHNQIAVMQ